MSPLVFVMLRVQTRVTGQQRARMVVRNEYDEVLLLKGVISHGSWSLPGGGVERGETPLVAARRELREETGLVVDTLDITALGLARRVDYAISYDAHLYSVSVEKAQLSAVLANPTEVAELRWFRRDSLPQNVSPVTRIGLEKLL